MLSKIFIKEGNTTTAIEILQKANEFNVESSEVLTCLGLLYMKVLLLKIYTFNIKRV